MAKLQPAANWEPDAAYVLDQLRRRKPAAAAPWMRLTMTATILAGTVLVLVALPWQRLWTPKTEEAVKPVAQEPATPVEMPQQAQAEKAPEVPAVTAAPVTTPAAQQLPAPEVKNPSKGQDALLDLPDTEEELLAYLQQLAERRGVSTQPVQAAVTQPQATYQINPSYTDEGRQAKVQGTVEMTITVKTDGTVQFESFKKTLGYGLDEKAREAIEQWKFRPATKDGVAVATTVNVSMNFSLR